MILITWLAACPPTDACEGETDEVKFVDWHARTVGTGADLHGASLFDGRGWIVGAGGAAGWTEDGGEVWAPGDLGEADLFDVARTEDVIGIAVGAGGTVLVMTDATFDGSPIDVGTSTDLHAIDLVDRNGVIAGDGALLRSTDGGAAWDLTSMPGDFRAVTVANAVPWAVGDAGAAATWGGTEWTAVALDTTADLAAVAFVDADHGVIAGSGEVLFTTDAGATFAPSSDPPAEAVTSMATGGGAFFASGAGGTIYRSQDGGDTWLPIHASGVAGVRGITTFEDGSMPNTQLAVPAPGDQVLIYGSRYETADVSDRWDCP